MDIPAKARKRRLRGETPNNFIEHLLAFFPMTFSGQGLRLLFRAIVPGLARASLHLGGR
jgi:hypothetical protein